MQENSVPVTDKKEKNFPIWRIFYRSLILMIAIVIACGAIGTALGFVKAKDSYKASTDIILKAMFKYESSSSTDEVNNNTLAKKTLPTIIGEIKSPMIAQAAREVSGDEGINLGSIGTSYTEESLIFTVSYTDADKAKAVSRLSDVIEAIKSKLNGVGKHPGVSKVEFVEVFAPTADSMDKYNMSVYNNRSKYIIVGFVCGIALAVCAALLVYVLDNKIKDMDELEEISNTSLLAVISK